MRRDNDGKVDGVVAGEGAAGNAFGIKVLVVVAMRRSACAWVVKRSRVRVRSVDKMHVTGIGRSRAVAALSLQMRCGRLSSRE